MTSYVDRQGKPKLGGRSEADLRLKNNRLGMNIFQVSWIMVFLAMIIVNWQLRFSYTEWPPAGVAPFDPLLPSAATLALLLSSVLVRRGLQALRREQVVRIPDALARRDGARRRLHGNHRLRIRFRSPRRPWRRSTASPCG